MAELKVMVDYAYFWDIRLHECIITDLCVGAYGFFTAMWMC